MYKAIDQIKTRFENLNYYDKSLLNKSNTVLVVVDMINAFAKSGSLYSDRVKGIISPIVAYVDQFVGYKKIYFIDSHTEASKEFDSFPPHGIDEEAMLIRELDDKLDEESISIRKNSTNGFFAPDFGQWLECNFEDTRNYVIVGDCTDLCIMQLALSIKAFYNQWDMESDIIIPINAVETFDLVETNHDAELMNLFALYNMELNGIKIVKGISE